MFVLISYDIEDDKLRAKVADVLEGHGRRVQYSVFECNLTQRQYNSLKQRLFRLVENVKQTETCSLRFYRLCKACTERFECLGGGDLSRDETFYIV